VTGPADAELTELIAAHHGLGPDAARFLNGETVDELEAQAADLAKLLGAHPEREPEPEPQPANPFAALFGNREKHRRERAIIAAVTGRTRPRDPRGRFTALVTTPVKAPARNLFDAGPRTPPPLPPPSHDEWLVAVLRQKPRSGGSW
jgi:hypothetical protein